MIVKATALLGQPPRRASAQRSKALMKPDKLDKASTAPVCNSCGACCRNYAYIRLSPEDIETLEKFTGLTAEEFSENIDKAGEKRFMKFQTNGDCIFLEYSDGAYSCSVYEARSVTCRDYPSSAIQQETCRVCSGR